MSQEPEPPNPFLRAPRQRGPMSPLPPVMLALILAAVVFAIWYLARLA